MPEADRDHGTASRADQVVDARVLGQILTAQNLLFVLHDEAQIASFFAEALGSLPGVAWRVVCLSGWPFPHDAAVANVCEACPAARRRDDATGLATVGTTCALARAAGARTIRVGTSERNFGFFALAPDATGRLGPYWPFLENLAAFIALSLENRGQKLQLEASRDELERRVEARTRDLTAANEALRESEERYRRITETMTDYVYRVEVVDGRAGETVHGAGCVAVTGYTPEDLARDPNLWITMVVPEDRPAVLEQAAAVLAQHPAPALEHRIVRKDGVRRWVRNTPVPQVGPDGQLVACDGLIQDITERRLLQEQLLQAQKMESIGRLAGGVAHDFNNLLTAVLGNAMLAGQDLPVELGATHPVRRDLEEVVAAGERAASLTRQLLAFASKQRIEPVRLDLSSVVADSLNMLRRLLGEDIEVITRLELSLAPVEADPGQIQQLLVNLVVNARDAMPDGGQLTIETANEPVNEAEAARTPGLSAWRYARLSVTDTGTGMTDEVQAHLFEPFFTTKERGRGTGLGLAICHGIVKQMGGQIRVASQPGRGSRFDVMLPQVESSTLASQAPVAGPAPTGTETLLVVEDEPAVRRLAVLTLRARGYTVLEASGATEALDIVANLPRPLDALVSDVVMPGMSGPQLAERLRRQHPGIRLLLMSGHAETTVLPQDVTRSGAAFLPKPFTPSRLAERIREVLDAPAPEDAGPDAPALEGEAVPSRDA
jgi:two-component system cell cycle sensor histidine kinase/response regulator CckA